MFLHIFRSLFGTLVILSALIIRIDSFVLSRPYVGLARCKSACLIKGKVTPKYFKSSTVSRDRPYFNNDYEHCFSGCDNAFQAPTSNCDDICGQRNDSKDCLYGCEFQRNVNNERLDISTLETNSTSPFATIRLLCWNLKRSTGDCHGRFKIDLLESTEKLFVGRQKYPMFVLFSRHAIDGNYKNVTEWYYYGMEFELAFARPLPTVPIQLRMFMVNEDGLLVQEYIQTDWFIVDLEVKHPLPPSSVILANEKNEDFCRGTAAVVEWTPNPLYPSCYYRIRHQYGQNERTKLIYVDDVFRDTIYGLDFEANHSVQVDSFSGFPPVDGISESTNMSFRPFYCSSQSKVDVIPKEPKRVTGLRLKTYIQNTAFVEWDPPSYSLDSDRGERFVVHCRPLADSQRCSPERNTVIDIRPMPKWFFLDGLVENCSYLISVAIVTRGEEGPRSSVTFHNKLIRRNVPGGILKEQSGAYARNYALFGVAFLVIICIFGVAIFQVHRAHTDVAPMPQISPLMRKYLHSGA